MSYGNKTDYAYTLYPYIGLLLEQILNHLPIESLSPVQRVSKYCRQVIPGSLELRRIMFLDPVPATDSTEYVKYRHGGFACSSWRIVHDPSESSTIVKAHPWLVPPREEDEAHWILHYQLEKAPSTALLFQPQPPGVTIHYRGHQTPIHGEQGFTFGAVIEALDAKRHQDIANISTSFELLPWTPVSENAILALEMHHFGIACVAVHSSEACGID